MIAGLEPHCTFACVKAVPFIRFHDLAILDWLLRPLIDAEGSFRQIVDRMGRKG